jgi:6-phosphogluconolactonase (cycloisomerase 2 family)
MRIACVVVALCACGDVQKFHDAAVDSPPDAALPQIASVTPARGIVTTPVMITGSHFGATAGSVTVGGVDAHVTSWNDTAIAIAIPDVLPGDADVVVASAAGAAPPATFAVILPPTIYLENDTTGPDGFDNISVLTFDETTGAATQVGEPVSIGAPASGYGGCSKSIWVNVPTRRLFATAGDKLAIYDIDPVTGAITPIAGSPFAAGGPRSFAVVTNAAGTRVFVDNFDSSTIGVFDIAADGQPTPVPGSPFAAPTQNDTFILSKDETYLYTNYWGGGTFAGMSVAPNGALAALPGTNPSGASITRRPGTDQLYVAETALAVWNVAGDGSVSQLAGSPFATGTTSALQSAAFTPDGNRVYFAPFSTNMVYGYSLAADGTPTALAGSPFTFTPPLSGISCVAMSQDGTHLIAADEAGQKVGVFTFDASGAPTQVANSPFTFLPANGNPSGLAITF